MSTPVVLIRGTQKNGMARMNTMLTTRAQVVRRPLKTNRPAEEDAGERRLDHADAHVTEEVDRYRLEERDSRRPTGAGARSTASSSPLVSMRRCASGR